MYLLAFICALLVAKVSADDIDDEIGENAGHDEANHYKLMEDFAKKMMKALPNETDDKGARWTKDKLVKKLKTCYTDKSCNSDVVTSVTEMGQVVAGIDAADAVYGGLEDVIKASGKWANVALKIAGKFAPFLGAIGPLVSLAAAFGTSETDQMISNLANSVNKGFLKMEHRFDSLGEDIKALGAQIEQVDFYNDLEDDIENLVYVNTLFGRYDNATEEQSIARRKDIDDGKYWPIIDRSLHDLKNRFLGNGIGGSRTVCQRLIAFLRADRKKVGLIAGDIFNKMLQGAVNLIRLSHMNERPTAKQEESDAQAMLEKISNLIADCDSTIKTSSWQNYVNGDIKGWIPQDPGIKWVDGIGVDDLNRTGVELKRGDTKDACFKRCLDYHNGGQYYYNAASWRETDKKCFCDRHMFRRDNVTVDYNGYQSCYLGKNRYADIIASKVYNELTTKYYWKEWYVLAYHETKETIQERDLHVCGTHTYNDVTNEYRVMVSSNDKEMAQNQDQNQVLDRPIPDLDVKLKDKDYGYSPTFGDTSCGQFYDDFRPLYKHKKCDVKIAGVLWYKRGNTFRGYAMRYHRKNRYKFVHFSRTAANQFMTVIMG